MPFLYFLLLHPEAEEKNRTQQRGGAPYGSLQAIVLSTKTSERFFYQENSKGPIKVPQKRVSQGWLDVNVGKGACCQA